MAKHHLAVTVKHHQLNESMTMAKMFSEVSSAKPLSGIPLAKVADRKSVV